MQKQLCIVLILLIGVSSFLFSSETKELNNGIDSKYNGMIITKIEFSGLKRTKESVVRAVMNIKEKDVYQKKEVAECYQRIQNLGIFSSVKFFVRVKDKDKIVLIIKVVDPWTLIPFIIPLFNSNTGLALGGGIMDSNFLGYGNKMLFVGNFNYKFGQGIDNFGVKMNYDFSFPDNNLFSYSVSGDISRNSDIEYDPDNKEKIVFNNEYLRLDLEFGVNYKVFQGLSVDLNIYGKYINNSVSINNENKEISPGEYYAVPELGLFYNTQNYSEGGTVVQGNLFYIDNYLYFNQKSNFFISDYVKTGIKWGFLWWNILNYVGQARYVFVIDDEKYFGGDGWVRGFNYKAISGDTGLFLNNEFRLKVFKWKNIGKFALAGISDTCFITDNFDYTKVKFYTGAGMGLRFYPAFLGGVKIRFDVAYNALDLSAGPEIIVNFDEMF